MPRAGLILVLGGVTGDAMIDGHRGGREGKQTYWEEAPKRHR